MNRLILAALAAALAACGPTNPWPVEATNAAHPVGNSSREYQQYTGAPYYHGGIDVREPPSPDGPWLRSVDSGTVGITYSADPIYHGITISSPDPIAWGYWHVDSASITDAVLDAWIDNTMLGADVRLGQIVVWPSCGFHHVHFFRQGPGGETDPMVFVRPRNESARPTVHEVVFAQNAGNTYFTGTPPAVSGDVDIVAQISDSIFTTQHLTGAYDVKYKVQRRVRILFFTWWKTVARVDSIFPRVASPSDLTAMLMFKRVAPRVSNSNYCGTEVYYYVVTNGVESGYNDANGFWDTDGGAFRNGRYRVRVTARDARGNKHTRTQEVDVAN